MCCLEGESKTPPNIFIKTQHADSKNIQVGITKAELEKPEGGEILGLQKNNQKEAELFLKTRGPSRPTLSKPTSSERTELGWG